MAGTGLALAALSIAAFWIPRVGMYVSLGLALGGLGLGWIGYRRVESQGSRRLCAAGAVTLGGLAALIAGAKVVLTLFAIDAIGDLL